MKKRTALYILTTSFLSSVISLSVSANSNELLQKQRKDYEKLNELLTLSQSESTQQLARQLYAQLIDYPLAPYAEYTLMSANQSNLSLDDIEAYQQKNPNLPLANILKREWLKQRQQKQDWQSILNHAGQLPLDIGSQCILLQAKTVLPLVLSPNSEQTPKQPSPPSAKFPQEELATIWLTGQSLPSQCDPLLSLWHEQGGLTPALAQQRSVMAYEQGNSNLLRHLEKQFKDEKNKRWPRDLNALLKSPANLLDSDNLFYIESIPNKPLEKRVILASMPAYIKNLNAQKIDDLIAYFSKFETWATRLALNPDQVREWKKLYLAQFFDNTNPAFQTWRDEQLLVLKDDKLTERRIRMAIREKDDIKTWLDLLSETSKNKEEWQYWLAQSSNTAKMQEILTALSQTRGFYGMLAAQQLGKVYQPKMLSPQPIAKPTEAKTAENQLTDKLDVAQHFKTELARIAELRYFKDETNINREWRNLLDSAHFDQKIALSEYATNQGWFDLGVETTIQAKSWDYISLRLPNAYSDWFDINLINKNISKTFAMSIARQESAWKPMAISSAKAIGLMQLLPSTAELTAKNANLPYVNENQLFDPFNNIMLGTAHLQELFNKYGNNRILIAAAYNAGQNRVDQWLERANGKLTMAEFVASIPFFETRSYVQNVLAYDAYYQILQGQPQQLFSKEELDRLY